MFDSHRQQLKRSSENGRYQQSAISYQLPLQRRLAPGNRGDDADLVLLFDGFGFLFKEADVLVVNEDVPEAPVVAGLVDDALAQAGEGFVETIDDFADIGAGGLDDFELVGEL